MVGGDRLRGAAADGDEASAMTWDEMKSVRRDWRIVYRMQDSRTGERVEGRITGFSKGIGPGWVHIATDTPLRVGTPIELELSVVSDDGRTSGPFRGAIAHGTVREVSQNPDPEESEFIIKLSVDTIEQEQRAA
jgi:hypothetical protein